MDLKRKFRCCKMKRDLKCEYNVELKKRNFSEQTETGEETKTFWHFDLCGETQTQYKLKPQEVRNKTKISSIKKYYLKQWKRQLQELSQIRKYLSQNGHNYYMVGEGCTGCNVEEATREKSSWLHPHSTCCLMIDEKTKSAEYTAVTNVEGS